MTGHGTPLVLARAGVGLAARVLPTTGDRLRYRGEFLAEMYGMGPADQLRHAAGVLATSLALRAALGAHPSLAGEDAMTATKDRVPFWRCRVFRWHDWVVRTTPDGARFQRCRRCGRDRGPVSVLPVTTPPWPGYDT